MNDLLETDTSPETEAIETGVEETQSASVDPISAALEKAQATIDERDSAQSSEKESPISDAARTLASHKKAKKAGTEAAPATPQQKDLDQSAKVEEKPRAEKVQAEGVNAPHFWSPENKALFSRADPGLQKAITGEVQKIEEWARGIAQEAKGAVEFQGQLNQVFEPYSTKFRKIGATPLQVVDRLMAWQDELDLNPAGAIRKLLASYNLSPEHLMAMAEGDPYEQYADPRVDEAQKRIDELESQIQAMTQAAQGQRVQAVQSALDKFINETDEQGNLVHPHVNKLEPQIVHYTRQIRASQPMLSEYQVLKTAYARVMSDIEENFVQPKISTVQNQVQKQEVDQKRAEQAKRAASTSLRGSPAPGAVSSRPKPKSTDEALEMAWSHMNGI